MPVWLTAALTVTAKTLASIARSVMALLAARELGRVGAERDAFEEERKQRQQADDIYEHGSDDYPDRYRRD